MKQILGLFALAVLAVFGATSSLGGTSFFVHAATPADCQQVYGGGNCQQNSAVTIKKTVQNPQSKEYVENLGVNDARYTPEQTVSFKITLSNTSTGDVQNVKAKDVFPSTLEFVSGPGKFDKNTKTLSFDVGQLKKGDTKTYEINGKIVPANRLPNQAVSCVVNQSSVTANNKTSQDNAQFCIQKDANAMSNKTGLPSFPPATTSPQSQTTSKGGLPVQPQTTSTTSPSTGPEMLGLLGLLPAGALGAFLRRKA